jgi:hypothetical protein
MNIHFMSFLSEFSSYKFHLKCRLIFIEVEYLTQCLPYRFMELYYMVVDAEGREQNIVVHSGLFTVSGIALKVSGVMQQM